ncbi:MAG: TetR family transcriptional regulator [Nitrospira sp.]|nr:TetR family transcriptional regulator [Nitrospira sp.]
MRISKRTKILESAIRVIHRDGVTGVTFDAVAAEAGITRGGMLYHFPSRDALLLAIHQYLAGQWEAMLVSQAGKLADEATADERLIAYVQTCIQSVSRVELQLMLEGSTSPELAAPWNEVADRWVPALNLQGDDSAAVIRTIIRLAGDGLWVYESLSNAPLSSSIREGICRILVSMIRTPEQFFAVGSVPVSKDKHS